MTVDNHPHKALSQTEISQDFNSHSDFDRRHQFLSGEETVIDTMLDDETIIKRFAWGKKRLVVNENLRIDYAHNSLQLSTPNSELIAIHKISERLHYILIKKDSEYAEQIQNTIAECQFIPIETASKERGFTRYQKYEIPAGYTLHYEPAEQLWQTWRENRQQENVRLKLDILILARSKWYRVQEMLCIDDRLDLQTRLGLISLSLRDRIAWIARLGEIPTISNANLSNHQHGSNNDSDILGKIISKLAIETSPDSDIHFESYTTMSRSFPGNSQDSSLLYEGDLSSVLTAERVSAIEDRMRTAAIRVLENYLEHGETIVRKEVTTDPQGNIISEKSVTIHRGCPKWAIEAVIRWQ